MSTILTNGLKLPDKGSVDWYADMQNNYAILDGAVGTIAEHTTQIAGKAPLVHTHTKSDITDFPVYGTTAGTICEGNDSRLSDARTPVAHTHTKSNITDLFNSANTWTALNTYSNGQIKIKSQFQEIGVTPSSGVIQYLEFADKNDAQHGIVGLWDYSNGASELQMYITDKFKNGAKDPTGTSESTILSFGFKADGSKFLTFSGQVDNSVIPKSSGTYDIGSSAYIWNNVYANTVNAANAVYTNTVWAQSVRAQGTSNALILTATETWEDGGRIFMYGKDNANGSTIYADIDHNDGIHSKTGVSLDVNGFYPSGVSRHLGLSNANYKWLTFNGINPGALSFPDSSKSATIDTTGYADSNNFYWTPPSDGWLFVNINHCSLALIKTQTGEYYINQPSGWYRNTVPVAKDKKVILLFACSSSDIPILIFYPCLGNV